MTTLSATALSDRLDTVIEEESPAKLMEKRGRFYELVSVAGGDLFEQRTG